ncbi:MAG TPA: FadR/GntR family transcriptional regulator [Geminicoccus sp.]|uniref:FadR/GntR family transcriptional regulator n=1 Tax=Geminicoccus sp. TaxID=2024832 RepID=UPI002E31C5FC|nr:FadR/GntR family transcriptional regulator [Geminicoccus sp.]HEX2529266.1 FadR/GntR family transcriptional regulator [Geminicoccus sp.]
MAKAQGRSKTAVQSAHRAMTEGIGLDILKGEFRIGELLPPPDELAERYKVSRTVQREAFKTLAAKGLVASKTKVGTWVMPERFWNMFDAELLEWRTRLGMDQRFIASLFEVRRALEPEAAALAAQRRSAKQVEQLRETVTAMAACTERHAFIECDLAFHVAITEASGNPFLQSLGGLIEAALGAAFARSTPVQGVEQLRHSAAQHRTIFRAIEARDAEAARAAMIVVINTGAENARAQSAPSG